MAANLPMIEQIESELQKNDLAGDVPGDAE